MALQGLLEEVYVGQSAQENRNVRRSRRAIRLPLAVPYEFAVLQERRDLPGDGVGLHPAAIESVRPVSPGRLVGDRHEDEVGAGRRV